MLKVGLPVVNNVRNASVCVSQLFVCQPMCTGKCVCVCVYVAAAFVIVTTYISLFLPPGYGAQSAGRQKTLLKEQKPNKVDSFVQREYVLCTNVICGWVPLSNRCAKKWQISMRALVPHVTELSTFAHSKLIGWTYGRCKRHLHSKSLS